MKWILEHSRQASAIVHKVIRLRENQLMFMYMFLSDLSHNSGTANPFSIYQEEHMIIFVGLCNTDLVHFISIMNDINMLWGYKRNVHSKESFLPKSISTQQKKGSHIMQKKSLPEQVIQTLERGEITGNAYSGTLLIWPVMSHKNMALSIHSYLVGSNHDIGTNSFSTITSQI